MNQEQLTIIKTLLESIEQETIVEIPYTPAMKIQLEQWQVVHQVDGGMIDFFPFVAVNKSIKMINQLIAGLKCNQIEESQKSSHDHALANRGYEKKEKNNE